MFYQVDHFQSIHIMKAHFYGLAWLLLAVALLPACNDEDEITTPPDTTARLTFSLAHVVNGEPLVYNATRYTNAVGQEYTIEEFRFYLSNIRLRNRATGEIYIEPDSYHLVTPTNGNNMQFSLELPEVEAGTYDEVEFSIGVDNASNYSLDQIGDLDPSNNMVWDWNTGYKFLLFEGRYLPASGGDPVGLVYHIGSDFNYKTLRFYPGEKLTLAPGQRGTLSFQVDLASIFSAPTPMDFSAHNVVMFQAVSREVAENYAQNMISLEGFSVE